MQVGNVGAFASDLASLTLTAYIDHSKKVSDHTLLYYKGKFRAPSTSVPYPNVGEENDIATYQWNGQFTTDTGYNAGLKGLDVNGTAVTDGTGYKWIVFRFNKVNDTTFKFNNVNYNLSNNILYFKTILSSYFESTTLTNIFTSNEYDSIGVIINNYTNDTFPDGQDFVGILQYAANPSDNMYSTGSGTINLYDLLNDNDKYKAHAAKEPEDGVFINPSTMTNDYFYLYIGLK